MPTRMKLSTAIRRGIKLDGKKIRNQLFKLSKEDQSIIGCCALGAALLGADKKTVDFTLRQAKKDYHHEKVEVEDALNRRLNKRASILWPESTNILDSVVDWNDVDGVSREQIAKRLEKLGK